MRNPYEYPEPWEAGGEPDEDDQPSTPSHKGGQVSGCACADCLDTRERLKVAMEAMELHGEAADIFRCEGCDHWRMDGDPTNERIGNGVYCPACAAAKKAALQAVTIDFHDGVRR